MGVLGLFLWLRHQGLWRERGVAMVVGETRPENNRQPAFVRHATHCNGLVPQKET
jgi:hypothetical protein